MNIIAFDLSLNSTGYSIFTDRRKLIAIGSIPTDADDALQIRLKKIGAEITKIKKKYKPEKIIFERGFSRFNHVTQVLFRVFGVVNYLFYNIEQIYIPSKTVRKIICGHGNIKKNDFFEYVKEKYKKINFQNNDEADSYALGLAYFAQEKEKKRGRKKTR